MMAISKVKTAAAVLAIVCLMGGAGAWISAGVSGGDRGGRGGVSASALGAGDAAVVSPASSETAPRPAPEPRPPTEEPAPPPVTVAVAVAQQAGSPADATRKAAAPTDAAQPDPNDRERARIQAQLDRALPELNFDGVGFADVIDFLRDVSGANIVVNWKALEAAGVDRNAKVSLRLKNVPFRKALESVLTSAGGNTKLQFSVDQGVITIGTAGGAAAPAAAPGAAAPGASGSVRTVYNVQKVIGPRIPPGARAQGAVEAAGASLANRTNALTRMITGSVAPSTWKPNGGTGQVEIEGNELIITTSPENHKAIANLIEQAERLVVGADGATGDRPAAK